MSANHKPAHRLLSYTYAAKALLFKALIREAKHLSTYKTKTAALAAILAAACLPNIPQVDASEAASKTATSTAPQALPASPLRAAELGSPKPLIIVHGAWGGGWDWKEVGNALAKNGYTVYRPSLTGLGDRVHLASKDIGLETHINDIVNLILFEDLHDVTLVGHSYGGMVITGAADRVPDRIARLVYVDAYLPDHNESLVTANGGQPSKTITRAMNAPDNNGFIAPFWVKPGTPPPTDVPHPIKTLQDTIILKNQDRTQSIPGTYILTVDPGKTPDQDRFSAFAQKARSRNFTYFQMDETDHTPERSRPDELVELITK